MVMVVEEVEVFVGRFLLVVCYLWWILGEYFDCCISGGYAVGPVDDRRLSCRQPRESLTKKWGSTRMEEHDPLVEIISQGE